jgi:glycosyltransferase involved in cell wall biosynthesis
MLNCLHIVAGLDAESGGPSRTVTSLCDALAVTGLNVTLATQIKKNASDDDLILAKNKRVCNYLVPTYSFLRVNFTPRYTNHLVSIIDERRIKLIHSHGLWLQCNRVAASISAKLQIPHVINPRGMLESWAIKHHYWKKMPFWHIWQKQALLKASLFCATSLQEAKSIRKLGFNKPIALIPNGVDFSIVENSRERARKKILFLGRLHPVKGLINLVRAWALIRKEDWQIIIAGPDEGGHQAEVEKEIKRFDLNTNFTFIGPVQDNEKWEIYRNADLFVLPTYSENFGIVVAESLASGLPVITTKGAPWSELEEHECGWWVDIGVEPLAKALTEATALSSAARHEMGLRGRQLVEQNYSWSKIGKDMFSVYEWVIGGGTPPSCVMLD